MAIGVAIIMIWSDNYITTLVEGSYTDIVDSVPCIVDRIALEVYAQIALYTLPSYVQGIRRITWLGKKLDPLPAQIYRMQRTSTPAGISGTFNPNAFYSGTFFSGTIAGTPHGTPTHYVYQDYGLKTIRLFPAPNISVASIATNLWGSEIGNRVIVEFFRYPDGSHTLPEPFKRSLSKYWVLSKAFLREGAGQDLKAAEYYNVLYMRGLKIFDKINKQCFVAKHNVGEYRTRTIPRPTLPVDKIGIPVEW